MARARARSRTLLLYDVSDVDLSRPRVLWTTRQLDWKSEAPDRTGLVLTGPFHTIGAVRIHCAGREPQNIRAYNAYGQYRSVKWDLDRENGTLLLKWNNLPQGVILTIDWR